MKKTCCFILLLFSTIAVVSQNETTADLLLKADKFYSLKEYDSSYFYARKGLNLSKQLKIDSLIIQSSIGLLFSTQKVHTEQQDLYFQLAKKTSEESNNWKLLANTYYAKGRTLYLNKEFGEALPYYLSVDSIAKKYGLTNEILVRSIIDRGEISRMSYTFEGVNLAHEIFLEALEVAEEINSEELVNDTYVRLADITEMRDLYDECKRYTDLAFAYYSKTDNIKKISRLYLIYANYYLAIEDFDNTDRIKKEGIAYLRTKDDPEQLASHIISYAYFLRTRRNNFTGAIENLKEAKAIYDTIKYEKNNRYMSLMEGLAINYAMNNDYKKSSEYYKATYELKKDFVKKANNDLTRFLETKYQTEKKEQEIALLTSQNELAESQKKNQRNILLGGLGLTTIAGLFFFFQFRNRQKTNKKLKELDTAKSTFFANISHEFRTPLTLIKGPIDDQLSSPKLTQTERNNLQAASSNTRRLESLVEQLLALSKLESGNRKIQVQPGNLSQFIIVLAEVFSFSAKEKQIDLRINVKEDDHMDWFDRDAVEKILFNLIGNALKYTPELGSVEVHGEREGTVYTITVTNTGADLTNEEREKIFERFYQTSSQNKGTGIGLALTKELVELHKGAISLPKTKKAYTTFIVELQTSKNTYLPDEILSDELQQIVHSPAIHSEDISIPDIVSSEDAPSLLIVDDNQDIRNYLSSIFESTYVVQTAENGKEGFNTSVESIPDIIISDVMMPEEDGFAFTKRIKENELTSHIPVVLLTAKTDDTDKLKGVGTGADAYITKPFNSELLRATVDNLLENRRKLQQRFSQEVILRPKEISVSSADEKFIERLQIIFDDQLTNPEFSVDMLGKEMAVSRMQLHRKLKALTGQSTSEFIRLQRLKLATHLLKENKISVSEIGYTVGFNDPSYFAKCFKQEFGCSPTEYTSA